VQAISQRAQIPAFAGMTLRERELVPRELILKFESNLTGHVPDRHSLCSALSLEARFIKVLPPHPKM